jgi:ApbE superfamily uncharacterized protein (UPF0280 family)
MPLRMSRKPQTFDVPVHDMVLRITAPPDYYEEARAAAMGFWEQLQAYGIRNPAFRTSKRPLDEVPEDAPEIVRGMVETASAVGVGPMFTFAGALTEHVGRTLGQFVPDVVIVNGGDYFINARKPSKLTVYRRGDEPLSVVVRPSQCPMGIYTTMGSLHPPARTVDGVAVLANSCVLADAAAAGVMAILRRPESFAGALAFLRRLGGVYGGLVVHGDRIGVAGGVEIAA